jgi:hypothetical protein
LEDDVPSDFSHLWVILDEGVPSGYIKIAIELKDGDFPVRELLVCQRVTFLNVFF